MKKKKILLLLILLINVFIPMLVNAQEENTFRLLVEGKDIPYYLDSSSNSVKTKSGLTISQEQQSFSRNMLRVNEFPISFKFDKYKMKRIKINIDSTKSIHSSSDQTFKYYSGESVIIVKEDNPVNELIMKGGLGEYYFGDIEVSLILPNGTYGINYHKNGGTITGDYPSFFEISFDTIKLPTNVTKKGYVFAGWYDNKELKGSPITSIDCSRNYNNFELYAKWEKETETITWNSDFIRNIKINIKNGNEADYYSNNEKDNITLDLIPNYDNFDNVTFDRSVYLPTGGSLIFKSSGEKIKTIRLYAETQFTISGDLSENCSLSSDNKVLTWKGDSKKAILGSSKAFRGSIQKIEFDLEKANSLTGTTVNNNTNILLIIISSILFLGFVIVSILYRKSKKVNKKK